MKRKKVDKSFKIVTLIISICVVISIVFFGTDITINDIIGVYPIEYILSNYDNETYDSLSKLADDILEVHFVDQTTPNMIQRISGIFERKPLISKEI